MRKLFFSLNFYQQDSVLANDLQKKLFLVDKKEFLLRQSEPYLSDQLYVKYKK